MTSTANNQPPAPKPNRRSLPAPRRGGRRPGAGGKPGNLNALKHGRRSAQFAQLGALLATIPETRQALLHLAARHRLKQRKAEQVAALLLNAMMERARSMAERQTINHTSGQNDAPQIRRATEKIKPAPNDQTPDTMATAPSITQIRKAL
jgi:hypothetical protein